MKIRLNQTVIKQLKQFNLAEPNFCPAQIKYLSFSENIQSLSPTDSMRRGIVFETLCLDLPPRPNKESEIPLLKNGNTPTHYLRIIEQAWKFKDMVKNLQMELSHVQETITYQYSDDIELFGTVDFVSPFPVDGNIKKSIIDLKLTSDVNNTFGPFSWGDPSKMDHTQASMYVYLYEKMYGEKLDFLYMVFDYSPSKGTKIVQRIVNENDIRILEEDIQNAKKKVEFFENNEWMEVFDEKRCLSCPIKISCKTFAKSKGGFEELRNLLFDLT